ncbi:MAG: serine/threonine protein kinase [Bradymonadia bacterium]
MNAHIRAVYPYHHDCGQTIQEGQTLSYGDAASFDEYNGQALSKLSIPLRLAPLPPGTLFDQRYRILSCLGQGGMAVVYHALDLKGGQVVALKVLIDDNEDRVRRRRRFIREFRMARMLSSPHTVRVHRWDTTPEGQIYICMEYLDGPTLHELLKEKKCLEAEEAVQLITQVCSALEEAHSRGIVHRDLKPKNLIVCEGPDGRPHMKLLDFGISKMGNIDGVNTLTREHTLLGSVGFMSPEQIRTPLKIDHRVDIYAIGMILYVLLMGMHPFQQLKEHPAAMLFSQLNSMPEPFKYFRPDTSVPEALEAIVFKALSKSPAQRYQSASELLSALQSVEC